MKFNLLFTRKTWYFFLLASACCGMLDGFAVLAGRDLSFLLMVSFAVSGIAVLFLAAEKAPADAASAALNKGRGSANPYAGKLFLCFMLLLISYLLFGSHMAVRLTAFWPVWVWVEQKRGGLLTRQFRLLLFAEIMQAALLLAVNFGTSSLEFLAALFWVLLGVARGWCALTLYLQPGGSEP